MSFPLSSDKDTTNFSFSRCRFSKALRRDSITFIKPELSVSPNLQASESRSSLTGAVPYRLNYDETAQNLQLGAK